MTRGTNGWNAADVVKPTEIRPSSPRAVRRLGGWMRYYRAPLVTTSAALFLILALAGRASLWTAIAADMGVSLLVVLNALRLACNQATNRDPVVDYDEATLRPALERALAEVKKGRLALVDTITQHR